MRKIISYIKNYIYNFMKNKEACCNLSKMSHLKYTKDKKIKIGFIVQLMEIWDKQVDVYECLSKYENAEVVLIVVPSYDFQNDKLTNDYKDNYFIDNYAGKCLKALNDRDECIDIEKLKFDYIFYPRPYDHYLPEKLRSDYVSRFVKCCYISYGFSGSVNFNAFNTNISFFRNMYYIFTESHYMMGVFKSIGFYKKNINKRIQKIVCFGYPGLVPFLKMHAAPKIKTVLWTPRWSYEPLTGGSHFLEFKDHFIEESRKHPDIQFSFRPHPLMFEELLKKGEITQEQVNEFLKKLKENSIVYDENKSVYDSVKSADVVISDFSSIVINIFMAERAIIYWPGDIKSNEIYEELSEGMYLVDNEEDAVENLENLLKGVDPLKDKRLKIKSKYYDFHIDSAKKISGELINDYNSNTIK